MGRVCSRRRDRNRYFVQLARPLAQVAALLAVSGAFVLAQRRRDVTRAAVFLGVGWCLAGDAVDAVGSARGAGVLRDSIGTRTRRRAAR